MKVDKCSSCPAHCCVAFGVGVMSSNIEYNIDFLKRRIQDASLSIIHRKDALKVLRWTRYRRAIMPDGNTQIVMTCSKLVDGKCSVYNIRPSFCRQYTCETDGRLINSIEGVKYEEVQN